MQDERVRHVMVEAVVSIGIDEPVSEAVRMFAGHPLHHLPVIGNSELKGMLSSADMLKLEHFLPKGGAKASAVLLNERFRIETLMRTPVVDAGNHLLGIVTTSDIMHALLKALREDVARYLRAGQDERLHSRLLKDLDQLGQPSAEVIL